MSLTLRILAPDQSVFDGNADEVILPSTTGQLGILPGHVSLLTALDTGVLRVRDAGGWKAIALLGGFAEVESDEVTVLVEVSESIFFDEMKKQRAFMEMVEKRLASTLNVGARVKLVEPASMPRHEGKAQRVIDKRKTS